jgi:hypothetical protein
VSVGVTVLLLVLPQLTNWVMFAIPCIDVPPTVIDALVI